VGTRGRKGRAATFAIATFTLAALLVVGCDWWRGGGGAAVDLQPIDRPTLDRVLKEHRGRVVLVDFWATWCPPCVELFPHSVDLARRYADRGLTVLSISLDDGSKEAAVRRFLAAQGATLVENFLAASGASPQTVAEFGIEGGSIPFLKVYDREGRLRATIAGAYPEKIDRAVEELLGEM
jgi:thiol-disulfide isomerase/thioredoxin